MLLIGDVELVFVVKLSKFCNLRCLYCYEHRELHVRDTMRIETIERLFSGLDRFGDSLRGMGVAPRFHFVWHGGEPLLLPPDTYAQIAELQRRHVREIACRNSVQTNLHGVLKDSLKFVLESDWELGVSLDFAGDVRVNAGGRDSNASAIAAAEALQKSGKRFGAISVLGAHNRDTLADAYNWVAEFAEGWRILPVFDGGPEGGISDLRLSDDEVVRVFLELFERRANSAKHIAIAPLDDYIKCAALKIAGQRSAIDVSRELLENIYVVNVNGDLFTRPFAYDPEFRLGNVHDAPLANIVSSGIAKRCREVIVQRKLTNCADCTMLGFCETTPMHEHGTTAKDGRCVVPRGTMLQIGKVLAEAGVDGVVIGDWARDWLASPMRDPAIA